MTKIADLKIKIYADGADFDSLMSLYAKPYVQGFTTNPTLMRKAGVSNYKEFAQSVLKVIKDKPISFEVFADDFEGMEAQGMKIASWGANVNVKIPVTNTKGEFTGEVIRRLSAQGVSVNVTAVFTLEQVRAIAAVLNPEVSAIVSIFAGRIADTGMDPIPLMVAAREILAPLPKAELLWASPRELLNIFQANDIGCHIITVTHDVLAKLGNVDKDLAEFSLDTVKMFYRDAVSSAFTIEI